MTAPPLIITVSMDDQSQQYFDELREAHFPKRVNYLKAHLTLFHNLPSNENLVDTTLNELAAQTASFSMKSAGLKNIGRGAAFAVESEAVMRLHRELQKAFRAFLLPQDKQKLWPHITIQNKVTPTKAKETIEALKPSVKPFTITATGFSTWLYLKGPWEHVQHYPFTGE